MREERDRRGGAGLASGLCLTIATPHPPWDDLRPVRQIAQNYKSGSLELVEVPVPACRPGGVVVRSEYSLISVGTEMMKIEQAGLSLVGKARARPDQVRQVMESVRQQGLQATYRKVMNRLDSYTPLGYSVSGVVVESGVPELPVGTRVACAGNEYALHAEFNYVPKNLCVPIPDGVTSQGAAFTTVGSIAMHGFRRAEPSLGEVACVVGLGLVGQILGQIARAAGLRVVGIDPSQERRELAKRCGFDAVGGLEGATFDQVVSSLESLSQGRGADIVYLTAASETSQPVELAAELSRDRARIVDVGKLQLRLPWEAFYQKELDLRMSRSYGPGRYDASYEEDGVDYPAEYVRWTQGRNMAAFLDLLDQSRIDLESLITEVVPFSDALSAYERLQNGAGGVGWLFAYPGDSRPEQTVRVRSSNPAPRIDRVRLGVIGAGRYASSMLLPHLARMSDVELAVVATQTALSGKNASDKFGFGAATTDVDSVVGDEKIDAVIIATRHDTHASLSLRALSAGKAVFVEKPLAISWDELARVADGADEDARLMVGFNRRFADLLRSLRGAWGALPTDAFHYTVNAGPLTDDSWVGSGGQGSRFIGEAGHFIDTMSWWLEEDPVEVYATEAGSDGLEVTLRYPGGAVGRLGYLTGGSSRFPKETVTVVGGGATGTLDNFQRAQLWRGGKPRSWRAGSVDKGQAAEMRAFVDMAAGRSAAPVSLDSLLATTAATLAAEDSAVSGKPAVVEIRAPGTA